MFDSLPPEVIAQVLRKVDSVDLKSPHDGALMGTVDVDHSPRWILPRGQVAFVVRNSSGVGFESEMTSRLLKRELPAGTEVTCRVETLDDRWGSTYVLLPPIPVHPVEHKISGAYYGDRPKIIKPQGRQCEDPTAWALWLAGRAAKAWNLQAESHDPPQLRAVCRRWNNMLALA